MGTPKEEASEGLEHWAFKQCEGMLRVYGDRALPTFIGDIIGAQLRVRYETTEATNATWIDRGESGTLYLTITSVAVRKWPGRQRKIVFGVAPLQVAVDDGSSITFESVRITPHATAPGEQATHAMALPFTCRGDAKRYALACIKPIDVHIIWK